MLTHWTIFLTVLTSCVSSFFTVAFDLIGRYTHRQQNTGTVLYCCCCCCCFSPSLLATHLHLWCLTSCHLQTIYSSAALVHLDPHACSYAMKNPYSSWPIQKYRLLSLLLNSCPTPQRHDSIMKSVIPDLMSSIRSRLRLLETKSQLLNRSTQEA